MTTEIKTLIKLADTLDKRGFEVLANIIDEAINKIADDTYQWQQGPMQQSVMQRAPQETEPKVQHIRPGTVVPLTSDVNTIKKVQRILNVKQDGIWGPKTAAAWNELVKTVPGWQNQGVDPSGKYAPAEETIESLVKVVMGGQLK